MAIKLPALLLAAVVVAGCTHKNKPLDHPRVPGGERMVNRTRAMLAAEPTHRAADADELVTASTRPSSAPAARDRVGDGVFFGIAISGGGSRSANFSAACLFELERLGLLQRADYISSVSGGSLTAAYYCLSGRAWNPANVQQKLTQSFATDVVIRNVLPWNFLALMFTHWDRSDLLADSFREKLFSRGGRALTFADLRTDRPHLLINATDLQTGKSFVFSNESFDELNSDLSSYPIAHAVAASSAVPVLLHHVTLRDYSTTYKTYRHLLDGGVSDNLGIRTLADMYQAHTAPFREGGGQNPYPRGAVFIVIDARTHFDAKLSDKADIGLLQTLATGAGLTSTVLLNRASSATLSEIILDQSPDDVSAGQLRRQRETLEREGYVLLEDRGGLPVHVLHLALSRVDDIEDLPFTGFHERVNNIATYFNISSIEAFHLYQAAELLVERKFASPLKTIGAWVHVAP